jgi:hypothetical protein
MAQFDSAAVNSTIREIVLASCGVPQEEEGPIVTGLWTDDCLLNGRLIPMPSLDEATQLTSMAVDRLHQAALEIARGRAIQERWSQVLSSVASARNRASQEVVASDPNVPWVDAMVAEEPERSGSARGSHGDPDQGGDLEAYTSD